MIGVPNLYKVAAAVESVLDNGAVGIARLVKMATRGVDVARGGLSYPGRAAPALKLFFGPMAKGIKRVQPSLAVVCGVRATLQCHQAACRIVSVLDEIA